MVRSVELSEADQKQLEEGGALDPKTLKNRKYEYEHFMKWIKDVKKVENIEEAADSVVEECYNEYFFTLRVTPTVKQIFLILKNLFMTIMCSNSNICFIFVRPYTVCTYSQQLFKVNFFLLVF